MGRILIILGAVIVVLGVIFHYAPWLVNWFGKLPGDIRIERENSRVFFPITSMILISVAVSLLLNPIDR